MVPEENHHRITEGKSFFKPTRLFGLFSPETYLLATALSC